MWANQPFWRPFSVFYFKTRLLLFRAVVGHFNSCSEFHCHPNDTGHITFIKKTNLTIKQIWDLPSDKNSMQLEWYALLLLVIIITITFAECYSPINFNSTWRGTPVTFKKKKSWNKKIKDSLNSALKTWPGYSCKLTRYLVSEPFAVVAGTSTGQFTISRKAGRYAK